MTIPAKPKTNPLHEIAMMQIDRGVVEINMLTVPNYTPYCGRPVCKYIWPRTKFNGSQFECKCGWESRLEPEFITEYKLAQEGLKSNG